MVLAKHPHESSFDERTVSVLRRQRAEPRVGLHSRIHSDVCGSHLWVTIPNKLQPRYGTRLELRSLFVQVGRKEGSN